MQPIQLIHNIVLWIYNCTLLTASIYAVFRFRKVDKGARYICAFIWLSALSESIGWLFTIKFKNNLPVYAVCNITELVIISLYFNNVIAKFRKLNIGIIIALTGIILGTINIILFEPINTINFNFVFFECVVIVCQCLYLIFRMLIMDDDIFLGKEFHFWITCTLLFYQCASLWNWGIYNYTARLSPGKLALLNISMILINAITYFSLMFLLYRFPKLRKSDV